MADRRRRKKKDDGHVDKPSDEETAVGKHLRFNLPTKTSNFMGHKVDYFTGSKAVDLLLDSKWATGKGKADVLFTDRSSVVHYLDRLLHKGMFHRALKVVKKAKKEEKKDAGKEVEKEIKKTDAKTKKDAGESKKEIAKSKAEKEEEQASKLKKTKEGKRKIKLEPTDEQAFRDGNDAFVWIYDPIKPMYYVYGLLLVVGAVLVCLFPLWPPWMRSGTYYVSMGGAGIVGSILALAVARFIFFVLLWVFTVGRLHFWLFPNLLADVGILESFRPTYEYSMSTGGDKANEEEEDEEEKIEAEEGEGAPGTRSEKNKNDIATKDDATYKKGDEDDDENKDEDANEDGEEEDGEEEEEDGDGDGDEDEDENADADVKAGEEDTSRSSSNRDEFEFIDQEDVSAES